MPQAFEAREEIDDPTDSKPADWVDNAKMDDPESSKPAALLDGLWSEFCRQVPRDPVSRTAKQERPFS